MTIANGIGDDALDDERCPISSLDSADLVAHWVQVTSMELGWSLDVLGQCHMVLARSPERNRRSFQHK